MTDNKKGSSPKIINWKKIKNEFIAGETMRSLARRYGLAVSTISERAKKEGWKKIAEKVSIAAEQKVVERTSDALASIMDKYADSLNIAIDKIHEGIKSVEVGETSNLRVYVQCLKDIKEIGVYRSDLDKKEQEARIKKLEKDASLDEMDKTITVKFEGDADEYIS